MCVGTGVAGVIEAKIERPRIQGSEPIAFLKFRRLAVLQLISRFRKLAVA